MDNFFLLFVTIIGSVVILFVDVFASIFLYAIVRDDPWFIIAAVPVGLMLLVLTYYWIIDIMFDL